jgi:hypothetical protein
MKVHSATPQAYHFINSLRTTEQATIRHQQNLKNLERMNRETNQSVEAKRATQHLEAAKFDRVRQAREAYLGEACQKDGHNHTMLHVDVKV